MIRIRKVFTALLVFAMVMILMPWVTYANRTEAANPPGNVTWQELDDNTSTDLSGYYRLERDLDIWHGWMPKEYRIVDDTYIDLNMEAATVLCLKYLQERSLLSTTPDGVIAAAG